MVCRDELEPAGAGTDIEDTGCEQVDACALGRREQRAVEFGSTRDQESGRVGRQVDIGVRVVLRFDKTCGANSHGGQLCGWNRVADERERAARDSSAARLFAWM